MVLATTFTRLISLKPTTLASIITCFHPFFPKNVLLSSPRWKRTPPFTPSIIYRAKMRKFNYAEASTDSPSSSSSAIIDSNFSSTQYTHHGNIVKILKRNVYPTVVLPIGENNDADVMMNSSTITTTQTTTNSYYEIDHYFMGMALQQARYAQNKGEVPIGAVIVKECTTDGDYTDNLHASSLNAAQSSISQPRRTYQILSRGHNLVETSMDASAHAELVALRQGAKTIRNWRYPPSTTLYSTLEPCPICLASIQAFRIDHIVFGALDHRLGAITSHIELLNVAKHPYHEVKSIRGGIREIECGEIVKNFFRERRHVNKIKKKTSDEGAGKDEAHIRMLKLPRQTKIPPWKRVHYQKVPSLRQKWKNENMGGCTDIRQNKLLKVSLVKRKPILSIYNETHVTLLNFVKALLGRRRE